MLMYIRVYMKYDLRSLAKSTGKIDLHENAICPAPVMTNQDLMIGYI